MAHITAGDLLPILQWTESAYNTPTGDPKYYGDVAEGGGFTPTDTMNPYVSWRYGNRSPDLGNYVNRQLDAGFQATLEVRDVSGWTDIMKYALGNASGRPQTSPYGDLPSRTEAFLVRTVGNSTGQGRRYTGCKTDTLKVSCDEPGGIVKFEETVLAATAADYNTFPSLVNRTAWDPDGAAVQWTRYVAIAGSGVYPQSFSLTINNNLDRVRIPGTPATTGSLIEGRREMTLELELWMEDLTYFRQEVATATASPVTITLDLGIAHPYRITLTGTPIREGQHSTFIQDKQKQTVRFIIDSVQMATVS